MEGTVSQKFEVCLSFYLFETKWRNSASLLEKIGHLREISDTARFPRNGSEFFVRPVSLIKIKH